MIKKIFALILIILVIPFSLSGCYDADGIENLAYVIAIGVDKGKENVLNLTFQFATPSSSGTTESSTETEQSTTISVECPSINNGLAMINGYISKKTNLSHAKVIVISEELATEGVSTIINTLSTNLEIRPNCNVLVSRCDASDFIKNVNPSLTNLTSRYYETLINSMEYTGFLGKTPIWKFQSDLHDNSSDAVAILCSINDSSTHKPAADSNLLDADVKSKARRT